MASNTSTVQAQAPTFSEAVHKRFDALDAKQKRSIRCKITRKLNSIYKEKNITSAEEKKDIRESLESNLMLEFMPAQQASAEPVVEKPEPVVETVVEEKSEPIVEPVINAQSSPYSCAISRWQQSEAERAKDAVIFNDFDDKSEDSYDEFETMQEYQAHQAQVAQIIETDKDLVDHKTFKLFDCLNESNFMLNSSGKSPMFGFSKIIRSMLGNNAVAKSTQRQIMIKKNVYTSDLLDKTFNWKQDLQRKASDKQIRFLANQDNKEKYLAWIQEFEPAVVKQEEKIEKQLSDKELKMELINEIVKIMRTLPNTLIYECNEWDINELLITDTFESLEQVAYAIKSTYAYIINNSKAMYMKKKKMMIDWSDKDKSEVIDYEQGGKSLDAGDKDEVITVKVDDVFIDLKLCDILKACRKSIIYKSADVIPYSAKNEVKIDRIFNLFPAWQHKYDPDFVVDMEIVDLWLYHIRSIICDDNEETGEYLINWFAHILQHPELKTQVCPILKSNQGAGKNFIMTLFNKYVVNPNMATMVNDIDKLTQRFNSVSQGKLIITCDEAMDSFNKKASQVMKNKISQDRQLIEHKGEDLIDVNDIANYIILTNNNFQSLLEKGDRRYLALLVNNKYAYGMDGAKAYWDNMYAKLMNVNAGNHLFHYLLNIDLSEFDIRKVPMTEYKKELKSNQTNNVIKFMLHLYNIGYTHDSDLISNACLYDMYVEWSSKNNETVSSLSMFNNKINEGGFNLIQKKIADDDGKRRSKYFRDISYNMLKNNLNEYIMDDDDE